jgi:hypothetical protein
MAGADSFRRPEDLMKQWLAVLCGLGAMIFSTVAGADTSADSVSMGLAAIESAKALARAGRGSLLMVGSILSPDERSQEQVVVVLDYPLVRDMKPGMVLILAKLNCEPIEECLIARRVTRLDAKYGVETEPYGGAEGLLLTQINATLLGSVAYTVNLGTGAIHDLRPDTQHAQGESATISINEAAAHEAARTRATPAADPHGF